MRYINVIIALLLLSYIWSRSYAVQISPNQIVATQMTSKQVINMNEEEQVLKFIDPDNIVVTLKTTNNFENAELTDQRGIVYYLKRVKTKNGIRLENGNTSIHFNSGSGILKIGQGRPIKVIEVKS
ncbi:hypothetical protein FHY67_12645 [Acinetobacter radioresistens]|jgi:hypothetical protein|uniref:Uncharacterized protein n=4 Tax=Moraxellaceae TaxID=468 RepID=A0A8H2K1C2_ACIRA|nr:MULTISPECIES: hypothetical protein [Acinetobacter]MCU4518262.1 hypothetical protein [Acinetobacter radioresistens]ENV89024.1 hypothetical protein F939_01747 [Acinetobacter radioresistens DSM 6976 = NBRC 102413 = CIP 103788]MCU4565846.1 hypothetical protein [Acinetobacter radioresistens]PKD79808.1 hypothetical protein CW313_14995 [Acinetobacter radioresistens]PKH30888.1 hypothetical protein BJF94_08325 [Acinetobacter radioresistens]